MPALTTFNDGACVHHKQGAVVVRWWPDSLACTGDSLCEDLPGAPRVSATCSATTAPTTRPKGMDGAHVRAHVGSIVKISCH